MSESFHVQQPPGEAIAVQSIAQVVMSLQATLLQYGLNTYLPYIAVNLCDYCYRLFYYSEAGPPRGKLEILGMAINIVKDEDRCIVSHGGRGR